MAYRLLYVFSRASRAEQERLVANTESPSDLLYGYLDFDPSQWEVSYIGRYQNEWSFFRKVWFPFEWLIARFIRMGFALNVVVDNFRQLRRANVIVTTADVVGLPVALLKSLHLLRGKVIYISQGLTDRLESLSASSPLRWLGQYLYGALLRSCEKVLVLGEGARQPLLKLFKLPEKKVSVVLFGVDDRFWFPLPAYAPTRAEVSAGKRFSSERAPYLLSVGSDLARDYETLLRAPRDIPLKIVTRLSLPATLLRPDVEVKSDLPDEELRQLYQKSLGVIIPLHDVTQPSGQSATLQAMACGKAVILTRTRGLWEPKVMQHLDTCYLVEPGHVASMAQALRWLHEHPAEREHMGQRAREIVEKHYTARHLAQQIEATLNEVL